MQPLNEQGKKIVDKIRERLDDARETCEKLLEEGRKESGKGKATRKAKLTEKLSRYFLKQIDKVVFPDKLSFSELNRFQNDLEKMLSSIARERNTWFPRISPLFIIARKKADFALSRFGNSLSELTNFLSGDYSKVKLAERLFLETDEIIRLQDELSTHNSRRVGMMEKTQLLQDEIEKIKEGIESTRASAEIGDLSEIKQKIQQLRNQVKYELRHLQKPFMKFTNLAGSSGYALTSIELEKFSQYLEDPFAALATEESGYPVLKNILKKVGRAIDEKKLKLKSSRLRKARESIDLILNKNTLAGLHQNSVQTFSLNKQLASSEETRVARRELKQSQLRLEALLKRKEAAAARIDALEAEHKRLIERAMERKGQFEKSLFEILGKRVNIEF